MVFSDVVEYLQRGLSIMSGVIVNHLELVEAETTGASAAVRSSRSVPSCSLSIMRRE